MLCVPSLSQSSVFEFTECEREFLGVTILGGSWGNWVELRNDDTTFKFEGPAEVFFQPDFNVEERLVNDSFSIEYFSSNDCDEVFFANFTQGAIHSFEQNATYKVTIRHEFKSCTRFEDTFDFFGHSPDCSWGTGYTVSLDTNESSCGECSVLEYCNREGECECDNYAGRCFDRAACDIELLYRLRPCPYQYKFGCCNDDTPRRIEYSATEKFEKHVKSVESPAYSECFENVILHKECERKCSKKAGNFDVFGNLKYCRTSCEYERRVCAKLYNKAGVPLPVCEGLSDDDCFSLADGTDTDVTSGSPGTPGTSSLPGTEGFASATTFTRSGLLAGVVLVATGGLLDLW